MKKHRTSALTKVIKWTIILLIAFVLLSIAQVLLLKYIPITWTPLMTVRKHEAQQQDKTLVIKQQWVGIENISPEMVRAVMASEDNLFLTHHGFSERGIRQAIQEKVEDGAVKHGGSTISQQTAKNVFTTGSRSYLRKAFEGYYTLLIEWIWGKERIMEVYLNVIEMGDGIFGVGSASEKFFHRPASKLTRSQAALIAVCLPNPRKLHVDRPSAYVLSRQGKIMILMPKLGKIDLKESGKESK